MTKELHLEEGKTHQDSEAPWKKRVADLERENAALRLELAERYKAEEEKSRLLEATARECEITRIMLDTSEALSTTLQLDTLLELVLSRLQQVVPYDTASISLLRTASAPPSGSTTNRSLNAWIAASRGLEHTSSYGFELGEHPLVQRVVEIRNTVIVPDVRDEPAWSPVEGFGSVLSWLCAPLISKDRVIGVLMIGSCHPDVYDEKTAHLVLSFARQVSLAIDNSRLYGQTQAQLRETLLLHSVTAALSSTLDADQMLPYVARSLCEALNGTSVEIYRPTKKGDAITVVADYISSATREAATSGEQRSNLGQTYPLADFPTAAEALAGSRPVQIRVDDPVIPLRKRADLEARGAQAGLLLPMVAHGHAVGLAALWEGQSPRRFSQGETATGQTLTHQAAIAMEHARLFQETQRQLGELLLLHNVSLAAASGLRLEDTLQAAADALVAALKDARVAVMLLDPESGALYVEVSARYPLDMIQNLCLQPGEGITGWVVQHGAPILLPDVHEDTRYIEVVPDTRSELCVPLVSGAQIIGVINVESPHLNAFTNDDLRLLSTVASNLAVLVERARLFEEVEDARIELQQRAEALEEANARLQELDRLKDRFLADVSHEFRTPLSSIIGFSEVLLKGVLGEMNLRQREGVQNILSSGEHLLDLINDLLDISKIEAGRMTLEPTAFEALELLTEAQATIAPLIEKKSQVLTVAQDTDLLPLTADRLRIKQVLLNLLSNASKFTPAGGHITLSCELADPDTMLFSVTDTGIGIKQEDREIIFEEFRQATSSAVHRAPGTGLGLTISKHLVEMHGGHLWVESEYGHGAIFFFSLPLAGPSSADE